MILVLCDVADESALWAMAALRARGHSPTMLTGSTLASVERWHHTVDSEGARWDLSLPGGTCLRSQETRGVLNRLPYLPSAWQHGIGGPDRGYAIQEMYAFYLSWLHALPGRKLNPPTPQGLCGNWRHPSAWAALAHQVGLPVHPYQQTSAHEPTTLWQSRCGSATATVHVVGTCVVGAKEIVQSYRTFCIRLAELANTPLLGLDFSPDRDGIWRLARVSVMPNLISGGEELADALAGELA
jgi:hypothetical protein